VAKPGEEVTCVIVVKNGGEKKAVDAQIIDHLPDYLDLILPVVVEPEDQGSALPPRGQELVINIGTIGKDTKDWKGVEVVIRARVRDTAPAPVCVENVAKFTAYGCPSKEAAVVCIGIPETGRQSIWWTVAGGLGTVLLVLSLVLAQRDRA
jgi:uncharacterized repeat protein (TIGR01451 family)